MNGERAWRRLGVPPPLVAIGAWVALILALHPLATRFLPPSAEDILRYLLLGLGIPALGLWWALRWPGSARFDRSPLPWLLAVVAVGAALAGIATLGLPPAAFAAVAAVALALAVLQAALLAGFRHGWDRARDGVKPGVVAAGFAGWSAALAALPQMTWSPSLASLMPAGAVAVVGLTVLASWWGCGGRPQPAARAVTVLLDVLAVLVIAALSFRTDGLFVTPGFPDALLAHHHWSYVVGPALAIREGGWPLWDVPTPYGFLNTVLLAEVPVGSVWQSLYLFNALFTALMQLAIYLVLRAVRRGVAGQVWSLLVTAGLFFAFTDADGVIQRYYFPSFGPFRLLWSFVLLGILARVAQSSAGSVRQRRWLIGGCLAWTIAVLWSFESAFYASAVWLPGFAVAVIRDRMPVGSLANGRRAAIARLAGWGALPLVLLGAAASLIGGWYLLSLGRLPDPYAIVEFSLAYNGGAVVTALGWQESAGIDGMYLPVIGAVSAMFATLAVLVRRRGWPPETGVLAGAAWMVWSWGSYLIARRDSGALFIAVPALVLAIGVYLLHAGRRPDQLPASAAATFRASVLPVLVLLPLGVLARPQLVATTVDKLDESGSWNVFNVEAGLPPTDPELAGLAAASGLQPGDPVVAATRQVSAIDAVSPPGRAADFTVTSLSPAQPPGLMGVLSPARRQEYLRRWTSHHPLAGWVVQRKAKGSLVVQTYDDTGPWFWEQLFRTHVPTRAYDSEHWDLVWVEPAPPEAPRPTLRDGRWMLDDRLLESRIPGVWASWGAGALDERGDGSATVADGTVLNLYSDEARRVRLAFDGSVRRGYVLALDGVPAGEVDPPDRNGNMVELALAAGWSRLEFTAAPAQPGADPAVRSRVSGIVIEPAARQAAPGKPSRGRTGEETAGGPAAGPEPEHAARERRRGDADGVATPSAVTP